MSTPPDSTTRVTLPGATDLNEYTINNLLHSMRKVIGPDARFIVPVSGGSDSALVLWLCSMVGDTLGVHIDTRGDTIVQKDLRCREWFESTAPIRECRAPGPEFGLPEPMRWAVVLSIALQEDRRLVGSRNYTEAILGTYSLASRVATYLPIQYFWKSRVLELCAHIGVPKEIIDSSREADIACGRPSEYARLPIEEVDKFLYASAYCTLSEEERKYLYNLQKKNDFKRSLPVTFF